MVCKLGFQTRRVYGLQAGFSNCIHIGLQGLQQKICKVAFGLQTANFAYGRFLQSAWGVKIYPEIF